HPVLVEAASSDEATGVASTGHEFREYPTARPDNPVQLESRLRDNGAVGAHPPRRTVATPDRGDRAPPRKFHRTSVLLGLGTAGNRRHPGPAPHARDVPPPAQPRRRR